MNDSARAIAENASFQAFINCYLREIDSGKPRKYWQWQKQFANTALNLSGSHVIELNLPNQQMQLLLELDYWSIAGRHNVINVYRLVSSSDARDLSPRSSRDCWQRESFWWVLMALVKELYAQLNGKRAVSVRRLQLELTYRLTDSLQNMVRYIEYQQQLRNDFEQFDDCALPAATQFIDTEQNQVFGHWLHPTPKSRQGILDWQQPLLSPEMGGRFQLHGFAIKRAMVQWGFVDTPSEEILTSVWSPAQEWASDEYAVLPVHPLQAHWLLHQPHLQPFFHNADIRYLGPGGPEFYATSSVRTVYRHDSPWMLKLSIPVKITNSMRQNKRHELHAGLLVAQLLQGHAFFSEFPAFHVIHDPAFATVSLPSVDESGFEIILRQNPFMEGQHRQIYSLASLLQNPVDRRSTSILKQLIQQRAKHIGSDERSCALEWFEAYWRCAIEPVVFLYDRCGVALEAHQQNSLLRLRNGLPVKYYFRDNQGYYLAESARAAMEEQVPQLQGQHDLFYCESMIIQRFSYYLLLNQLCAVIHRLGFDQLLPESLSLAIARKALNRMAKQMSGRGRDLVEHWLSAPVLASKANLLTRIEDIDELEADQELAVYADLANPLCASARRPFAQGATANARSIEYA